MRALPLLLLLLLAPLSARAEVARVVRMSDGDSGRFLVGGVEVTVRVLDLDTLETGNHARCDLERQRGEAAKAYAFTILPPGKVVELRPKVGGKPDKYGRMLADVTVDGFDYASHMVAKGLGVRYDGGRKVNWCGGR